MGIVRSFYVALALTGVCALVGCATLSQQAVGRTDRLRGAPFYKTYAGEATPVAGDVASIPVALDESMSSELFYTGLETALQPLLLAMNEYLAEIDWVQVLADPALPAAGPPSIYVGSSEGEAAPLSAEIERMEHEKYPPMVIHVGKPSPEWRTALQRLSERHGFRHVLWIRLGLSEYPKADRGLFGKKVVLGTGYEENIRFLSAEDVPVEVLQVSGMLLDGEGNILRAGAEGILSKDSPFWVQIFGARQGIDEEAVRKLLDEERRTDLPGEPLKWRVALHNLVAQLLERPDEVNRG